jgi:hypothetical protein
MKLFMYFFDKYIEINKSNNLKTNNLRLNQLRGETN